jgi:uncharacterized protein
MRFAGLMGAAALLLASTNMMGGSAMAANPMPTTTNPTVAIGASGTEESMPDIAVISAGLETKDAAADAAMEKNSRDFAKIMAVVKKYGIAPKDMQTTGVTVREDYDYTDDGRKSNGFVASNSLSVTIRDLKKVGAFMSDLVAAGANNVSGPIFSVDDNEALTDKAREKAFDTAQRRALAYARKAGCKAVRLLTINEGAGDFDYAYGAEVVGAAADAAAAVGEAVKAEAAPIEPGEVSQTVYASFLFEMVP